MLSGTYVCRAKAAAAKLHFRKAEREPMTERILSLFEEDHRRKNIVIPEYEKKYYAISATTRDGKIAGACAGYTAWNEMHVDLLSANPDLSVPGAGKALIQAMEALSRSLDCTTIALDTYSWQAKPFYEKMGFRQFGVLESMPAHHTKYFMEKTWPRGEPMTRLPLPQSAAALTITPSEQGATETLLHEWLQAHTQRTVDNVPPYVKSEFAMEATLEDGTFAAGCVYETLWNDLHISFFAANPDLLNRGIGGALLDKMTEIAKEKGCIRITLETMSWQAKPFYEANGFREFGAQHSVLPNGARHYLQKVW